MATQILGSVNFLYFVCVIKCYILPEKQLRYLLCIAKLLTQARKSKRPIKLCSYNKENKTPIVWQRLSVSAVQIYIDW
jgi:hypothetical protein